MTNSNIEEKILEIFGNFDFLCKLQQTGGYPEVRSNSILNRHGFNQNIFAFIIVSPSLQGWNQDFSNVKVLYN